MKAPHSEGSLTHWEGEPVGVWEVMWSVPRLEVWHTLPSTNDRLRDLVAQGALPFTTVIADEQTAGRGRAGAVLERLDLPVGDKRNVGQWSKGMKMRLTLARSLLNRPRLWFLDEPTTGQDPQHAVLIRRLIRERANAGASVFLTTHDMTVADELCDRVAFLVDGRIALMESPRKLKLAHARTVARVEYREGPTCLTSCGATSTSMLPRKKAHSWTSRKTVTS